MWHAGSYARERPPPKKEKKKKKREKKKEHTDRQITGKNWGQNVAPLVGLVKVAQLCPAICNSTDYATQGILQARWAFSSPGDLPKPGIEPRSAALWGDSPI